MPLPADLFFDAIPDLGFTDKPYRIGTCPACEQHGLTLKLLVWPNRAQEYEAFCPHGCPPEAINEAVLDATDATHMKAA